SDRRPDAPRGPRALVPGLVLVGAATLLVLAGARLVPTVSPLVVALVLGALVAPAFGRLATTRRGGATVAATRPGVAWTSRVVLRVGVVLLGFQLSLPEVLGLGWRGLVVVTTTLAVTFAGTLALGRVLRVPRVTTLLVATGFSVCGAAAISAMQGVVDRPGRTPDEVREDDDGVATALALVTVYGTLAIVVLSWLAGLLGLTDDRAGLWIGASVQEVAQVVTAAGTISAPALATATVAKLARVALLAPLVAVAGVVVARGARRAASALATTSALGAPVRAVWPEIWDDIEPLFDAVLTEGRATWSEDMPLVMNRSGFDEETYFTFSYSPLVDDDGQIAGVLDIVTETTREVVNQRRLLTLGELHAVLPTTAGSLAAFARPVVEVLARSADVARVAFYAIDGPRPRVLLEAGHAADGTEADVVGRTLATGQREVARGRVVKPLRDASPRGAAGVLVLQAATGRPWDDDYARYLTGIATTIGAALRDAARMRTTLDELRRRAERSEEETARARELALVLQPAVLTEPPQPEDLEVAVH
ncbi:MAG: YeiH family protein, partial [Cellulosimicrobium funkei]